MQKKEYASYWKKKETVPTDFASTPLPDQPLPHACPATMRAFPAVPFRPGFNRVPRDALPLPFGVRWELRIRSAPRDCTYTISGQSRLVKGVDQTNFCGYLKTQYQVRATFSLPSSMMLVESVSGRREG